jgi:AcrR family transcriptional regulator
MAEDDGRGIADGGAVAQEPDTPRARLLRAAREVVAAEGLEGLTLRAIARRARVSHGAPLRHFPTLASLLAAVAADGFTRLMATIDAAVDGAARAAGAAGEGLDRRERLAVAGRAYVAFALAEPGIYAVMFRPDRVDVTDAGYRAAGAASFGQLVTLVEEAQAAGWQPDERPEELAAVLWTHVHGVADLSLHGALPGTVGAEAPERVRRLSDRLVLRAVAPDPGQPDPRSPDPATRKPADRAPGAISAAPPTTGDPP